MYLMFLASRRPDNKRRRDAAVQTGPIHLPAREDTGTIRDAMDKWDTEYVEAGNSEVPTGSLYSYCVRLSKYEYVEK